MSTKGSSWFDKHTVLVRPTEWSGVAPEDSHVGAGDEEMPSAEEGPASLAMVPVAMLRASEVALALKTEELARADAELGTLRVELDATRAEVAEARHALDEIKGQNLDDAELELVRLSLAIAERVVGRELASSPELVVGWAREALAANTLGEAFVIAVSADVASSVEPAQWDDLAERLTMDPLLPPSTCELRDGTTTVIVGGGDRLDLAREQLASVPARAA